jgi:acyl transferase domain-containing protein
MGRELYENHEQFKYWMDYCDEIVSPLIQTSIINIVYGAEGKSKPFDRLLYSNPALLCIEYSLFRVLKGIGIQPDFLMGYSLGEITAAVVSGAIALEDGIQLVADLARLAEVRTQPAEMLAIMESQAIMTKFPDLFRHSWLTGTNFHGNFVVCGLPHAIQHLRARLNEKNILSQILPVKYGFHTELIDPIEDEYKRLVRKINLSPTGIPIVSSFKTGIVRELDEDYLWEVIRYPVNFQQTVSRILEKGNYIFIDSGPSGTLATCVKYMLSSHSGSISLQVINQFGRDLDAIEKLGICSFSAVP